MYNHKHSITTLTLTTIASITTLATTYIITKSIHKYGINGTLRYIWEGDHLPPHLRDAVDILDDVDDKLKKKKTKLDKVEIMMEVARLNSVDDGISQVSSALSKDLSMLSYTLDKIAAEIDSVQSHGESNIRKRKKELSATLVIMMEKVDGFLKECGIESS